MGKLLEVQDRVRSQSENQSFHRRKYRWTEDGRPICAHCNKAGHVRTALASKTQNREGRTGELGKFECPKSQSKSNMKLKVCPVSVGKNKTHALLDSGADVSLVWSKFLQRIRKCISRKSIRPSKLGVRGVTGQALGITGEIEF